MFISDYAFRLGDRIWLVVFRASCNTGVLIDFVRILAQDALILGIAEQTIRFQTVATVGFVGIRSLSWARNIA